MEPLFVSPRKWLPRGPLERGLTMVELVVVVFILGLILVPLVHFFRSSLMQSVKLKRGLDSQDSIRNAMREVERDFREMVQVDVSSATFIEFRLDSTRLPGYNPNGDPDGDGIINIRDADVDDDYGSMLTPATQWTCGFNLRDDDEFDPTMSDVAVINDGKIDVLCRYFVKDGALLRDYNYHEAGWGLHEEVLAKSLSTDGFKIEYFGNVNELMGMNVDLGNDGVKAVVDPGQGDRIITDKEIDMVLPVEGGNGNQSSLLPPYDRIDTFVERKYIFFFSVRLAQDANHDGKDDFSLRTEVSPLLLPVRRSLP